MDSVFIPYPHQLETAVFKKRYKRFFAEVYDDSEQLLQLHCPNTGAMTGLLTENQQARFLRATEKEMLKRKTPGTLEQLKVTRGQNSYWVGINTNRANRFVEAYLNAQLHQQVQLSDIFDTSSQQGFYFQSLEKEKTIQSESKTSTRVDFLIQTSTVPIYIEVKSVTYLENDHGLGLFPDAVSTRAHKQLTHLIEEQNQGYQVIVLYLVQHEGVSHVEPAQKIDPVYGDICQAAKEAGVIFAQLFVQYGADGVSVCKTPQC